MKKMKQEFSERSRAYDRYGYVQREYDVLSGVRRLHGACARAAFRTIANVLDAMILASIFVMISLIIISLVILGGLVNSLVLAVLVQLAAALIFRQITRKS